MNSSLPPGRLRGILPCLLAAAALALSADAAPGDLDPAFGSGGKVATSIGGRDSSADHLLIQADGTILVAGSTSDAAGSEDFALLRYLPDGALDPAFGTGGKVKTGVSPRDDFALRMAVQANGKILLAGIARNAAGDDDFVILRFLPGGVRDTTFGVAGQATAPFLNDFDGFGFALQDDQKILIAGFSGGGGRLVRFLKNGALDTAFGTNGSVQTHDTEGFGDPQGVLVQPDQKILVVAIGDLGFTLFRYLPDGSPDPDFGTDGIAATDFPNGAYPSCLALQSDGGIIIGGYVGTFVGNSFVSDLALARFTDTGTLDPTFGTAGKIQTRIGRAEHSDFVSAIAIDADDRILASGGADSHFALCRFARDGAFDSSFGNGGSIITPLAKSDSAQAVAIQADGNIVAAGGSRQFARDSIALVRYLGAAPVDLLLSADAGATFTGDHIFNRNGRYQNLAAQIPAATTATFTIEARNLTAASATFTIVGTAKSAGFTVEYFDDTAADITAAVTAGTYRIRALAAGAGKRITLVIGVKAGVPPGTLKTCKVSAMPRSATDTTGIDLVKVLVTAN